MMLAIITLLLWLVWLCLCVGRELGERMGVGLQRELSDRLRVRVVPRAETIVLGGQVVILVVAVTSALENMLPNYISHPSQAPAYPSQCTKRGSECAPQVSQGASVS